MKLRILFGIVLATSVGAQVAQAQPQPIRHHTAPGVVVQGLGERFPASRDLSLVPDLRVYRFEQGGIRYIQVNDASGVVLRTVGIAGRAVFSLPIGVLSADVPIDSRPVAVGAEIPGSSASSITTAATCPCSSQIVYQDQYVRIIAIYGEGGELISLVIINLTDGSVIK